MKIGIFDSGLGGLIVTHGLVRALPEYDYLYLGDTARVPYGNRSEETIYRFTREAVDFLFREDCALVIVACNTASAEALRRIQREYLPDHYPDRRVLGVLIPAAEEAAQVSRSGRIGILATAGTVASRAYDREIGKLRPDANVFSEAAPLLVPLIENDALRYAPPILRDYLEPLLAAEIDTLVLGCTHYPYLRSEIRAIVGDSIALVSQDEIIPSKLVGYLARHPEIDARLSKNSARRFFLTDIAPSTSAVATTLFGEPVPFERTLLSMDSGIQ
ncbi:MAG: glutamate racemase [Candidatus Moraniibacteriota bacterium]|nr:MAG: glutamate racemase [Candidatus Moranbacteria bacterium]